MKHIVNVKTGDALRVSNDVAIKLISKGYKYISRLEYRVLLTQNQGNSDANKSVEVKQ